MRRRVLLIIVALLSCAAIVSADDIYPPSWRGEANTTFQKWEFSNNNNPADLEPNWYNPYDMPTATIINPFGFTNWLPSYNTGIGEEYGVWKLYAGEMWLDIPNTDNTDPDSSKEIWLQITYYDPAGAGGWLPLVVDPLYASVNLEQRVVLDSAFFHDTYSIIIIPNPNDELIKISPIQCQLYIDEVVVDTICIPEPATICLLGLGGLSLFCKKR